MKKCYSKDFQFIVPIITCKFCNNHIKYGEKVYTIILEWGEGNSACESCYEQYEIDWEMRKEIDYEV